MCSFYHIVYIFNSDTAALKESRGKYNRICWRVFLENLSKQFHFKGKMTSQRGIRSGQHFNAAPCLLSYCSDRTGRLGKDPTCLLRGVCPDIGENIEEINPVGKSLLHSILVPGCKNLTSVNSLNTGRIIIKHHKLFT